MPLGLELQYIKDKAVSTVKRAVDLASNIEIKIRYRGETIHPQQPLQFREQKAQQQIQEEHQPIQQEHQDQLLQQPQHTPHVQQVQSIAIQQNEKLHTPESSVGPKIIKTTEQNSSSIVLFEQDVFFYCYHCVM